MFVLLIKNYLHDIVVFTTEVCLQDKREIMILLYKIKIDNKVDDQTIIIL